MPQTLERTELTLEGMTCASCAARVEKTLNRLDGVDATVNFATERAAVAYDPARVELEDLVLAVEGAGYQASPLRSEDPDAVAPIRRRLIAAAVLTAPLVLIAMISPLQFGGWEWAGLALATPVVFWGGLGFHRAAALRPGDSGFARPRGQAGTRPPWRRGGARGGRGSARRRPVRRSSGREDRDGRRRRAGRVCGRPVGADGRVDAGRGRARRRARGRDDQHLRPTRRAGEQGRRGDGIGADRAAGWRSAVREGARAAPGRPGLGGFRAGRDRDRARHARGLARTRRGCLRSVHRRGRCADHRVPLRARAGDA